MQDGVIFLYYWLCKHIYIGCIIQNSQNFIFLYYYLCKHIFQMSECFGDAGIKEIRLTNFEFIDFAYPDSLYDIKSNFEVIRQEFSIFSTPLLMNRC